MKYNDDDYWMTIGQILRYMKEYNLSEDTKIYVQMPSNCTRKQLKEANLHDVKFKNNDGFQDRYVRAWGPHLRLKEKKKNLYIDIYY